MSSIVFVVSSLETIAASKEAQRNKQLAELAETAVKAIKEGGSQTPEPDVVFAPLQLATKTGSSQLINTALDSIQKLISSAYLSSHAIPGATHEDGSEGAPMLDRAIDTICDCFQGETTPVDVQRHIIQALLASVLNDKVVVHGAGLLKAVRQVYNVFLLSRSTENQQAAQGTLTQMVGMVFERVKTRLHMKEARISLGKLKNSSSNVTFDPVDTAAHENGNGHSDNEESTEDTNADDEPETETGPSQGTNNGGPRLTLKDLEHRKSFDDSNLGDVPTVVTQVKAARKPTRSISEQTTQSDAAPTEADDTAEAAEAEDEVYIRDAYLVFRSFCNLSTKILPPDQLYDHRGQHMRSKMISLHLTRILLNNHIAVFTSPLCYHHEYEKQ
ncbi:hypothetical protein CIB48_g7489 [Xylaria polymorpha]|nr:hypothetical protein CIB48_g7489 [Xylaria polymorpha]